MGNSVKEDKETYEKTMEIRLGRLGARIDELQMKTGTMGENIKSEFNRWIEDLRMKQEMASQKFQNLKEAGSDIWEDLKTGLEKSAADLKEMIDKIGPKIRKNFPVSPAVKWTGIFSGCVVAGYFIGRSVHKRG